MFYAEHDTHTNLYCVFHTETGDYAYSSWGSMEDAEDDAESRNQNFSRLSNQVRRDFLKRSNDLYAKYSSGKVCGNCHANIEQGQATIEGERGIYHDEC